MVWETGIQTLIGTGILTLLLRFIDGRAKNKDRKVDEDTQIRKELRDEARLLREEVRRATKDLDLWKEKYFKLLKEHADLQSKYNEVLMRLERFANTYESLEDPNAKNRKHNRPGS